MANKRWQIDFYSANVKTNMQANKHMGAEQTGFDNNDWTQKQRPGDKQQFLSCVNTNANNLSNLNA